ncbi:Ig-like domain-containing protein [Methanobrevibacter sp.]|uniref:Ig-like domain-containing protein n=1 Tax=Methanobrevibacter sp. TaxID=66852 RepID=UPI00388F7E41
MKKRIFLVFLVFIIAIGCVNASEDANQTADDSLNLSQAGGLGADDGSFATLQNKIYQAPSGSTINLENDYRYNSDVDALYGIRIDKELIINGNGHTLDGLKTSKIFSVNTGSLVTFNNIVFINGLARENGGAISTDSNQGNLKIDNCHFIANNAGNNGGAVSCDGFTTISNCYFKDNSASFGGAIHLKECNVFNCEFINNYASLDGGSVYMGYYGYGEIRNCNFASNSAYSGGGAVFGNFEDKTSKIYRCNFTDNHVEYYGGAVKGMYEIYESNFNRNHADYDGGAVARAMLVSQCSFVDNYAIGTYGCGGAVYETRNVDACEFIDNEASYGGYAVYGFDSVVNSIFKSSKNSDEFVWDDAGGVLKNNKMTSANHYDIKISDASAVGFELFLVFADMTVAPNSKIELCQFQDDSGNKVIFDSNTDINARLTNRENGKVQDVTLSYNPDSFGYYYECRIEEGTYDVTGFARDMNRYQLKNGVLVVDGDTDYTLQAKNLTKYVGGPEKLTAVVVNGKGRQISGVNVNFNINGVDYARTTDSNGVASININLGAGNYAIKCSCGDSVCDAFVQVISTLYGNDLTKYYRNSSQYYVTCLDVNGDRIASGSVEFNINGVFYIRDITNGVARMNINLNPGDYIITARNMVNDEMHSNKIKVLTTIVENYDLTKYYKNDSQYRVRLLDGQGNPVGKGVAVEFNINGVFYKRTSDENGYVLMNINLNPGTYVITANYNSLMASNIIKVLPVIEADDLVMSYRDGSQFKAKLLDGHGYPLSGVNMSFNVNGVFYNRTTGNDGIARLNINLMAGEYIITSMYENGAVTSNRITIRS